MSQHQAFRRVAVPQQVAQKQEATTIPAPTRGLIESENFAYMQPGAAVVLENWIPTMRGVKVRGGCKRWCVLPEAVPVVSAFEYASGNIQKMFAAQETKLFDVTFSASPTLVKSGQTSGNYSASQLANQGGDFLIAVNATGDPPLRFNGTTWATLNAVKPADWAISTAYAINAKAFDTVLFSRWKCLVAHTSAASGTFEADRIAHPTYWALDMASDGNSWITGPPGSSVENGRNLTYVNKYRNRWFFVEGDSMNAWYLPLNAVGGALQQIPLSGSATEGGKLLWIATWSIDAGDGIDDKIVFCTDRGELLVFTGSNPGDAANWRQEGRYNLSDPLGINAHCSLGGDILIATVEGIVPMSAAITKTSGDLELAMITKNIKKLWRDQASTKRNLPWDIERWDEYGGMFVTFPGGKPGKYKCAVVNTATGAWGVITGWDATCWIRMRTDMFFGTQAGLIMQADQGGNDDGLQYTATLVGGWEMFQSPSQMNVWRMARASFTTRPNTNFLPYLSACTDFLVTIPQTPPAAPDPSLLDVWNEGLWDQARWDQPGAPLAVVKNTGWVSIGMTGYSHAPVMMATFQQQSNPDIELVSISATYERGGINV